MERVSVASSTIVSVGYDAGLKILEVEFKSGGIYQYSHVPERLYLGLLQSSSPGQYLDQNIKGIFPYEKVD